MTSPAKRHFQRVMAATAPAAHEAAAGQRAERNAYELMLAKLHTDRARLRDIQSIERKREVKADLLPEYDSWVDGVLSSGTGAQDDVLMTVLVWYIDVGQYGRALDIAEYALSKGLTLPDQYDRTVGTVLVDEIGDSALAHQREGTPFDLAVLTRVMALTDQVDMPDQARAKLHKALGNALRTENPSEALLHYRRALELHEGSGVKRDISAVEAELKKLASAAT